MAKRYYAGIGSRKLPADIIDLIKEIGWRMAKKGYILRSGAADGADKAFEYGCERGGGYGDIYLPWRRFKNRENSKYLPKMDYKLPVEGQMEYSRNKMIQSGIIPHWDEMNEASQKFHSRNVNQVEGEFDEPDVHVVIYYAPTDWMTGEPTGGTRTAVMLARSKGIPTYNLYDVEEKQQIIKKLDIDVSKIYAKWNLGEM